MKIIDLDTSITTDLIEMSDSEINELIWKNHFKNV